MQTWLFYSFVLTVLYQFLFFLITVYMRFDKVTDLAGGSNFLVLALAGWWFGAGTLQKGLFENAQNLSVFMVAVWSVRLATFLLVRVLVRESDGRFDDIRDNTLKLIGFWTMQVFWVWIVSLPLTLLNASSDLELKHSSVRFIEVFGFYVWIVGFVMETIADLHKFVHTQRATRHTKPFLDKGLWSWSRHPNYFGEILCWIGVWLVCARGLGGLGNVVLAASSPVLTFLLLVCVSGIPLAERSSDRKLHTLMAYKQYKHKTSILIPLPPSFYSRLSLRVKKFLLLDHYQLSFFHSKTSTTTTGSGGSRKSIGGPNKRTSRRTSSDMGPGSSSGTRKTSRSSPTTPKRRSSSRLKVQSENQTI